MKSNKPNKDGFANEKGRSTFKLTVDKAAFESSFDGFAAMGLAMSYQVYDGVAAEKLNVTIDTVDQSTGEVFSTVKFRRHLRVWSNE